MENQENQFIFYDDSDSNTPKNEEPKKNSKWVALLCSGLIGGIIASVLTATVYHFAFNGDGQYDISGILIGNRGNSVIESISVDTSELHTPAEVYAANVKSTVGITTSIKTNFWGFETTSAASGSGFIVSENGYVLTNYHVIDSATSITVSTYDGDSYDAELIGYDKNNDVAVLKIEAEGLSPVVIGDSDNLNVGDSVIAIGNPLGELTFSLTGGYVSAMDRQVTLSSNVTMKLIQTDCAINSGNSGGALFNLYGEVIGITNAKYSSSSSSESSIDNIGFAIPINDAMKIAESIIEKGYISKPYLGVSVYDVSAEAQQYGVPTGAAIQEVVKGSPAEKAGLIKGDVITKIGDCEVSDANELIDLISDFEIGAELTVTVYRRGETLNLTVTLEESKQSALE